MVLCLQLKVKISKKLAAREQQQRRKNLTKYIPNAAAAIFPVLESMAENDAVGHKRRLLQAHPPPLRPQCHSGVLLPGLVYWNRTIKWHTNGEVVILTTLCTSFHMSHPQSSAALLRQLRGINW